jgi:hypothetical protein
MTKHRGLVIWNDNLVIAGHAGDQRILDVNASGVEARRATGANNVRIAARGQSQLGMQA